MTPQDILGLAAKCPNDETTSPCLVVIKRIAESLAKPWRE
jgi:hypothetical protein